NGTSKRQVRIIGEHIGAELADRPMDVGRDAALLFCGSADDLPLSAGLLDGVFTDPPYFDNVQYAELIDFCYVWLRLALGPTLPQFHRDSTRAARELTGNVTLGRGIEHFTQGLSDIFAHLASALRPGAPFVFTYHHNDASAYAPLVVAILDAGMDCTATLPAPAEMSASLHIAGTSSSILDSVFVCRVSPTQIETRGIESLLEADIVAMRRAGVRVSIGDIRCLAAGHTARIVINRLRPSWDVTLPLATRLGAVRFLATEVNNEFHIDNLVKRMSGGPVRSNAEPSRASRREQMPLLPQQGE
nr:hypothetical protein [Dehalococcoidales bacterium]